MYVYSRTRLAPLYPALIGALVFVGACGGNRTIHSLDQRVGRSVITQDQVSYASGETAYDVIQHLRPEFFTSAAGRPYGSERLVYVNGFRSAGLEALRGIPAAWIQEIRLLSAGEAMLTLGGGHYAGALMIKLRRGWFDDQLVR